MSDNEKVAELTRTRLAQSLELDPEISARLVRARLRAVEQRNRKPGQRWVVPVAAAASVALLAVLMIMQSPAPSGAFGDVEALELLVAEEPLELYEELEFFLWLEEEARKAPGRPRTG